MSKVWDWTVLHWRGLFAGPALAGGVAGARVSVAGMAGVLSLLGSIASDAATGDGPSITKAEVIPPSAGDDDGRHRP